MRFQLLMIVLMIGIVAFTVVLGVRELSDIVIILQQILDTMKEVSN